MAKRHLHESCDDCIFIKKDKSSKLWDVLRTTKDEGRTATVMFSFHTRKAAYRAGSWIAFAINGKFWCETDPRNWRLPKK